MLFKIPNAQFILQNKQIVYLFTITIVFILDLSLISSQLFIFIYYWIFYYFLHFIPIGIPISTTCS
jgi:hypothetical protein